uniref:Peptidase C1A papain C-terminal domain-containing protein n=3 Tax=Meloidogyne TaxID=189290 RepID=A0A6V7VNB1_MELEN|nr:unnamed protein product [Meloidogyne enterolobii]
MKITTSLFFVLIFLIITSFASLTSAQILGGILEFLLKLLFGNRLQQHQIKEVVEIVNRLKNEFNVELSIEQIQEKLNILEKFKEDIEGSKEVGITLFHFFPVEMQINLLGGIEITNGFSDSEFHMGEVPDEELPQDPPEKSNKEDEHPRDKRAACTYKNVFSSRLKWSDCAPIINRVHHQGQCGSCWAVSTSTVITDRSCIEKAKKKQSTPNNAKNIFSALDILSCSDAGDCRYGYPLKVWEWMYNNGVCTGGDNINKGGCKPYPFSPSDKAQRPQCTNYCTASWDTQYRYDKRYIRTYGYWHGNNINIQAIIKELESNGPIITIFRAHSDLFAHKGGVYRRSRNAVFRENHVVEVIGHGIEVCNGRETPYWLIKNSWGKEFGEDGFFKMLRGQNECNIESIHFSYAIPRV